MIKYREIRINRRLVGKIEIDGGEVKQFRYVFFKDFPFTISIEDLAGVTSIGDEAFKNCTMITSIDIPYGVESIGCGAFMGCSRLESIKMPDSLTAIGIKAFSWCGVLKRIAIPESVKEISYGAFEGCSGAESIEILKPLRLGNNAFAGCLAAKYISIPKRFDFQSSAFEGCYALETVATSVVDFRGRMYQFPKILTEYNLELTADRLKAQPIKEQGRLLFGQFAVDGFDPRKITLRLGLLCNVAYMSTVYKILPELIQRLIYTTLVCLKRSELTGELPRITSVAKHKVLLSMLARQGDLVKENKLVEKGGVKVSKQPNYVFRSRRCG